MFSQSALRILEASGWFPGRTVSIASWTNSLRSEGFTVIPEAARLLEEFGGLTIYPKHPTSGMPVADTIRFDPLLAASGDFNRVDYWQRKLNVLLTPLAEVGNAMMLLAEDGRVFICGDNILLLAGDSFVDAMDNTLACRNRKPLRIGVIER